MYTIKLRDQTVFKCSGEETIFQGAQQAGVYLEHSCLNARCSSCKTRVLDGEVQNVQDELVLSAAEREQGYVLSCNVKPCTDLELDLEDLSRYRIPASKTIPAKIDSLEFLKEDVVQVIFRTPPAQKLAYLPGQYVNLIKGAVKRSYSIANARREDGRFEFLIKNYEGGLMSRYWFQEAKVGDLLRMEGPRGTFFMRDTVDVESIVFLATGTGIAPVKALLEEAAQTGNLGGKAIYVLWGGRYLPDLFWTPDFKDLSINYIPVLSREQQSWTGHLGYVQDVLLQESLDLAKAQVYACGSEAMIHAAQELLTQNGLPENRFFADAFVTTN